MTVYSQDSSATTGAITQVSADKVKVWDFRAAGVLDASRLAPLSAANDVFARNLASALARQFEVQCEITVRSIEMAVCDAFVEGAAANSSYFHLLILGSHAETGALQLDAPVLLALLDCLMGGAGNAPQTARDLTDIERQTTKEIVKLIAQELQKAWQAYSIEVKVGSSQSPEELLHTLPESATVLVPTFAINIAQASGQFALMLPIPCIAPFLKPTGKIVSALGVPASTMSARLSAELLENCFPLDLVMAEGRLSAKQVLNLGVGQVVSLGVPAQSPARLNIGGKTAFSALPVRAGDHRAAQLVERIAPGTSINSSRKRR
jgi:flagellar motor switch protein FliM